MGMGMGTGMGTSMGMEGTNPKGLSRTGVTAGRSQMTAFIREKSPKYNVFVPQTLLGSPMRGHGTAGGGQPQPPHPSPGHRRVLGAAVPPPRCPQARGGAGGGQDSPGPLFPAPWASQAVPPRAGGGPRSHLCDDLTVLRHVDLHGHAIRGAPQDTDRGRLRGRRGPWVPGPHPMAPWGARPQGGMGGLWGWQSLGSES